MLLFLEQEALLYSMDILKVLLLVLVQTLSMVQVLLMLRLYKEYLMLVEQLLTTPVSMLKVIQANPLKHLILYGL